MVFSTIVFLIYFLPVFLILYLLIPVKFKNYFILISSILFYAWGAPKFIFVILGTTTIDFYLVKMMNASINEHRRKLLLIISLSVNLGLLFYFKYCNFFLSNINHGLEVMNLKQIPLLHVLLPIGISFYTFETITYVVDVYRKVHKPLNNFLEYQLYIIFFPKLIAGPIVRYHEISDQINDRFKTDNLDNKLNGIYRFIIGLGKKVLIANTLGIVADKVFWMGPEEFNATSTWLGILAYTFQIYFDFSGYSDMALGLAGFMGFKLPENFNNPYTSQSITEFWQRWHITLGSWMKNYLYIPLGGNKVSQKRLYFNLWLVFLASGFWHGAKWTFIFWGVYHGLLLVLERAFLLKFYKKIGKFPSVTITFLLVVIGWVFFRMEHNDRIIPFLKGLFSFNFKYVPGLVNNDQIFYFILAGIFSFLTLSKFGERLQNLFYYSVHELKGNLIMSFIATVLFVICVATLATHSFNPFIYFRF